ncbi:alpha/beta fold hydrolase [Nakamurella sp. YIM 132084]|uniref:Alpha/beta fold hydrolase n=2 Tax=Nakamurella leprariae TaxID=2803911 RepID=A0A939C0P2_9ACTN|nr:alpha/beta fold hydrolase [Nakamurella leprariae]
MRAFARVLAERCPEVAVGTVRYRRRGWNDAQRDAAVDVERVLAELAGHGPVVLVGHSMGGRAAVAAAGAPRVRGVVALAPWLTDGDAVTPVRGRTVVLAHGARDRWVRPELSLRWAERAAGVPDRLARFVVPGDVHMMWVHRSWWHHLAVAAVSACLDGPVDPVLTAGFAAAAEGRLDVPLTRPGHPVTPVERPH